MSRIFINGYRVSIFGLKTLLLLMQLFIFSNCVPENGKVTVEGAGALQGEVFLTSLTGGQAISGLGGAQTFTITWRAGDGNPAQDPVNVLYSTDSGVTWTPIAGCTGLPFSVLGQCVWTIPAIDSTTVRVMVVVNYEKVIFRDTSSSDFTIDSTLPPTPAATRTSSAGPTNNSTATFTMANCNDTVSVLVTESAIPPTSVTPGWQTCSTVANAITGTMGIQGSHTVRLWAMDIVGHVSALSHNETISYDSLSPALSVTAPAINTKLKGGTTEAVTWTYADSNPHATPITLQYSSNGGTTFTDITGCIGIANSGSCNWSVPADNSSNYTVRAVGIDLAGNSGNATLGGVVTIDSMSPTMIGSSFSINSGATTTDNFNVKVSFQGADNITNITEFCIQSNDTDPNNCNWVKVDDPQPGLTPAMTLNLVNFNYILGITPGVYDVYVWVKDEVGHYSTLSSTIGTDKYTITYALNTPPVVTDILATNSDSPTDPPTLADRTATVGTDVYIKWRLTDAEGMPASPVSLYYSTDDVTWNLIAANLINGANGACLVNAATTADDNATGCYKWTAGSPTSSYYTIKVQGIDDANSTASATSTPLNISQINVLAGNSDPGTGNSANSAMFFNNNTMGSNAQTHIFAVSTSGVIFFNDYRRGILYVDPATGNQEVLIALDSAQAANNGDGGAVSSATVKIPMKIFVDYNDDLYIYDTDRIRKVTINPSNYTASVINTIIGGGVDNADTVADPLNLLFENYGVYSANYSVMFPLPNGDIIFQSKGSDITDFVSGTHRVRIYKPGDPNKIQSLFFGGTGYKLDPAFDWNTGTDCRLKNLAAPFDVSTSNIHVWIGSAYGTHPTCPSAASTAKFDGTTRQAFTTGSFPADLGANSYGAYSHMGMDGEAYYVNKNSAWIKKYNRATEQLDIVVGTGVQGSCPDGTLATACAVTPYDVFVTASGQVFFFDRNLIRAIDADGKVQTIYGQSFDFGDGGAALSARFAVVNSIDQRNSGEVVVLDREMRKFREFTIGGNINLLAGDGRNVTPNTTNEPTLQGILISASGPDWDDFILNPANGDVFFNRGFGYIAKLDRSTNLWSDLVGGGANPYYSTGDGNLGVDIEFSGYPPHVMGYDGTNLIVTKHRWSGTFHEESYLKLYDITDGTQTHLAGVTGAAGNTLCGAGVLTANCTIPQGYGGFTQFKYDAANTRYLANKLYTNTILTLKTGVNTSVLTTTTNLISAFEYHFDGVNEIIYYCDNTGALRKHVVGGADTAYTWPIPSMKCTGRRLLYNAGRNSLIFIFEQNGLYGVAEYLSP